MLVLNRKENEAIIIGDDIRVVIIRARKVVRLGIEAPGLSIHRQEVYDAIKAGTPKTPVKVGGTNPPEPRHLRPEPSPPPPPEATR